MHYSTISGVSDNEKLELFLVLLLNFYVTISPISKIGLFIERKENGMAETRKLYYENGACLQFCATVLSCVPTDGNFAVTLDATAFYPEGGGQPADRGALGGARVLDVHEKDGVVVHTVTAPLHVGEVVQGDVDGRRRLDHMQQHTGEHIVSGIVHAQFGYDNVGFHIGAQDVTVDFSGPLTDAELADVERAANWVIWQNAPVTIAWPAPSELAQLNYRSKKELTGAIRIVTVANVDVCACCGTHVERCGQVGSIKLTSAQSYKGGTRVTMLCGMRAYEDHCIKFQNAEAVSGLLSAKINETAAAVQRLADENAALRAEKAALETRLFAADAAAFRGRKNALVFEPHLSPDSLRRLCTALMEQCTGVCAAFSGTDAGGYKYALGSAGGADVHALCKEMNAALGGRGGGREMQQGSAACTRGDIEAFFALRLGE